jgi:hypothetical protein
VIISFYLFLVRLSTEIYFEVGGRSPEAGKLPPERAVEGEKDKDEDKDKEPEGKIRTAGKLAYLHSLSFSLSLSSLSPYLPLISVLTSPSHPLLTPTDRTPPVVDANVRCLSFFPHWFSIPPSPAEVVVSVLGERDKAAAEQEAIRLRLGVPPRLFSLGQDRVLQEYDVAASSIRAGLKLKVAAPTLPQLILHASLSQHLYGICTIFLLLMFRSHI